MLVDHHFDVSFDNTNVSNNSESDQKFTIGLKKEEKQCNRVREGQQNWQNLIAPQALFQQLYI